MENPATLVAHGCPLSIAHKVVHEGHLVAGEGHHYHNGRTVHGVFVMSDGPLFSRMGHARDRSTTRRCTEWKRDGLTGWSAPCVLVFPVDYNDLVRLKPVASVFKCALEMSVGTKWKIPGQMMLCVSKQEYHRYLDLPPRLTNEIMMCGGRDKEDEWDPIYWTRENNMPPSCGRTCPRRLLRSTEGWSRTPKKHIWFCSNRCRQQAQAWHSWENPAHICNA